MCAPPLGTTLASGRNVVTIAVDAMGGDDAPDVVVAGAAEASLKSHAHIVLVGDQEAVRSLLQKYPCDQRRISVEPADGFISMDAKPREALAAQPHASLPHAARLVAQDGGADALVSAGNSGAVILACAQAFRCLPHVRRTALCAVIPTERRRGKRQDPFTLLLDAGATLRVTAADLTGFALMGAAYASIVSQNGHPRVALLSNGHEPTKGTPEIVEAHRILTEVEGIDFIGNIEGVDIPRGTADVIVCDGFTGNISLKMLEGVSETVMNLARYAHRRRISWKLALWLLSSGIRRLKELTDWQQYGGAPILGFDRLCIKAHGRSGPRAVRNAIRVAERCVEAGLCSRIASDLEVLGLSHQ